MSISGASMYILGGNMSIRW